MGKDYLTRYLQTITFQSLTSKLYVYVSYFSKVVGIFLDLEDDVIMKLINDDHYFNTQVAETIRVNKLLILAINRESKIEVKLS